MQKKSKESSEMKLPIKLAGDVLKQYDLKQVIVLCRDKDDIDHMVTYGMNEHECKEAGLSGDRLKKILRWPDNSLSKYTIDLTMKKMGMLNFIAEMAIKLDDEDRERVERILEENLPSGWRYKRILHRFELEYVGEIEHV